MPWPSSIHLLCICLSLGDSRLELQDGALLPTAIMRNAHAGNKVTLSLAQFAPFAYSHQPVFDAISGNDGFQEVPLKEGRLFFADIRHPPCRHGHRDWLGPPPHSCCTSLYSHLECVLFQFLFLSSQSLDLYRYIGLKRIGQPDVESSLSAQKKHLRGAHERHGEDAGLPTVP